MSSQKSIPHIKRSIEDVRRERPKFSQIKTDIQWSMGVTCWLMGNIILIHKYGSPALQTTTTTTGVDIYPINAYKPDHGKCLRSRCSAWQPNLPYCSATRSEHFRWTAVHCRCGLCCLFRSSGHRPQTETEDLPLQSGCLCVVLQRDSQHRCAVLLRLLLWKPLFVKQAGPHHLRRGISWCLEVSRHVSQPQPHTHTHWATHKHREQGGGHRY